MNGGTKHKKQTGTKDKISDARARGADARKKRFCRFFRVAPRAPGTEDGCRNGRNCCFIHDDLFAAALRHKLRAYAGAQPRY